MEGVIPIFKSQYSIGRSILTLDKEDSTILDGPDSIIGICKANSLQKLVLVDNNMNGFLQAYTNTKEAGLDLCFGIRILITDDCEDKSEESLAKTCKYIIFAKNNNGYQRLIKIYSYAAKTGFYYSPRLDFKILKSLWSDKDLLFCVPFYDSFIFSNCLEYSSCVPKLDFTEPVFFLENNSLPFDRVIRERVSAYCKDKYLTQEAQSIFYKDKKDFKAYLTFRCINNRSTLDKPEFKHMGSDEFCFESWSSKNKKFQEA